MLNIMSLHLMHVFTTLQVFNITISLCASNSPHTFPFGLTMKGTPGTSLIPNPTVQSFSKLGKPQSLIIQEKNNLQQRPKTLIICSNKTYFSPNIVSRSQVFNDLLYRTYNAGSSL